MAVKRNRGLLIVVVLLVLSILEGCSLTGEEKGKSSEENVAADQSGSGTERQAVYNGLHLDALEHYTAVFTAEFDARDSSGQAWAYHLEIQAASPRAIQRSLSIEGARPEEDPGDVVLTLKDDVQYMTGEAVGESSCLIFPASVDLGTSFLTPDDFMAPEVLADALTPAGNVSVAGQTGTRYTFQADTLGDFTNVSGEIVKAVDGGYVLRYDLSGDLVDTYFAAGNSGHLTLHFEITDLTAGPSIEMPSGCQIDLPLADDATEIAKLPGMVSYSSAHSSAELVAFYEEALPTQGWQRYALPTSQDDKTLLVYARSGEFLNITVTDTSGGSEVMLLITDAPAAP